MIEEYDIVAKIFMARSRFDCSCCVYSDICEWHCFVVFYPEDVE